MAEYHFGLTHNRGRTAAWDRERRHDVADRHGCEWTEIWDGNCWRSWFSKRSQGSPFDERTESAVLADLKEVTNATPDSQ